MAWQLAVVAWLAGVQACYKFPADLPDPCLAKECPFGAECRPSSDGRTAECLCAHHCATYGDSRGSRPVCGSDGQDYNSVCELRRAACAQSKEIEIKYQGPCDPCDGVNCPPSQVCQLDEARNPTCRCNALCSAELKPVCGSDGRTYTNECTLRVEGCKSRRSLRIIYEGECSSGANPCSHATCGPGQECDIDRYGIAVCQCPPPCEPVLSPVCGSDGRTYDHDCQLRRYACFQQQHVVMSYRGHCGEEGPCQNLKCEYGSSCVLKSGKPVCECPSCTEEFQPVCGSDGITYENPCKLGRYACQRQSNEPAMVHEGSCEGCKDVKCDYYAVCKSDGQTGTCTCPDFCPKSDSPVCGSDGQTYENECEMRRFSCSKQQYISVTTRGRCDLCLNVHCKYGARCEDGNCVCPTSCPDSFEPVCANDGVTYTNECDMRKNACHLTTPLNALFYGECDDVGSSGIDISQSQCEKTCHYGGVCQQGRDGHMRCTCNFQCPRTRPQKPVCGSDGRLYDHECGLREEACRQQGPLNAVPCPESKECGGEPPLRDPISGSLYSCTERLDCPPSSVCQEGRCCRLVAAIKECAESLHGCCPDGKTMAHGPNFAGCPSTCNCNRLGSYSATCDPVSGQCVCKPGVGGLRCDRCEPGFWGLHKIAEGNNGCAPCGCNDYGSVRDDCEQMTGRCVCKHGIQGMKCDICPTGTVLVGPDGCMDASIAQPVAGTCATLHCRHGAKCREHANRAQCVCEMHCPAESEGLRAVCGADGNTYASECQLKLFSCRYQRAIGIRSPGPCKTDDEVSPTAGPVRRSTVHKPTGPFEPKSTRDITLGLVPDSPTTARPAAPPPVEVPAFSGRSFLELARLQAYSRLSLELEFRTFSDQGILLYNGQTASGSGDFVSLAVRDGYVEFRYNLGSGPVILRSPQRVLPGKFHRLVAKRYLQEGMIALDGQDDVMGRSQGLLKSLDLGQNLFLGHVPDNTGIWENVGVRTGLVGCIRRLKVGRKPLDLRFPTSKDILRAKDIRECTDGPCDWRPCRNGATCLGPPQAFLQCACAPKFTGQFCEVPINPCYNNPCREGSTCQALPQGGFVCLCDVGSRGRFCELRYVDQEPFTAEFDGSPGSYLELPTLQNAGLGFTLEVWFLVRQPSGLLLFNGQQQSSGGPGDFISLYLDSGRLHFSFDLGSGSANLSSAEPVALDVWHRAAVSRDLRQGTLQVDDGPVVLGQSKGGLSELNLALPLYVGGVRPGGTVVPAGMEPMSGAVQRLVVNGVVWDDLARYPRGPGVTNFQGPPCGPGQSPCRHGGLCEPLLARARCHCDPPYRGAYCEVCESTTDDDAFCSS